MSYLAAHSKQLTNKGRESLSMVLAIHPNQRLTPFSSPSTPPPSSSARLRIQYPMMFTLENHSSGRTTHCGVLEFVAEPGHVYLPGWVRYCALSRSLSPFIPFLNLACCRLSSQHDRTCALFLHPLLLKLPSSHNIYCPPPLRCCAQPSHLHRQSLVQTPPDDAKLAFTRGRNHCRQQRKPPSGARHGDLFIEPACGATLERAQKRTFHLFLLHLSPPCTGHVLQVSAPVGRLSGHNQPQSCVGRPYVQRPPNISLQPLTLSFLGPRQARKHPATILLSYRGRYDCYQLQQQGTVLVQKAVANILFPFSPELKSCPF